MVYKKLGGVSLSAKNTRRRGVKKSVVAVSKKSLAIAADVKLRAAYLRRCAWFWIDEDVGLGEYFYTPKNELSADGLPIEIIIGNISRGSLFLIAEGHDGKAWQNKLCVNKIEAVKFIRLVCSRRA